MIGKILSVLLGALTSTAANKTVGVANAAGWVALIPLAAWGWHHRDDLITFQASVGAVAAAGILAYAFVSAIVAVARRSQPPPPYDQPRGPTWGG